MADNPIEHLQNRLLEGEIIEALRTIFDPEIPVNIYDLGLIYEIQIDAKGGVKILMTLTTPMCPVAEILPGQVEEKVRSVPGVTDCDVELVWDPPWTMERIPEPILMELGLL
jgi:FeS assembly SUF system protein